MGHSIDQGLTARRKTGSYTGDGALSQAITGVGFLPSFVKIWQRETVDGTNLNIYETTPEIMDDNASGGAALHDGASAVHDFKINAVTSLDADGFTVDDAGTDSHPNKSGQVYNYIAHR